jgi:hypothetical protein
VATRLFYRLNGADVRAPETAALDLVARIADGSIRDVTAIAATLRRWATALSEDR